MTRPKQFTPDTPINPDAIYRWEYHEYLFGLGETAVREGIKNGTIPPPFALTGDKRKVRAWLGSQAIEYRRQLLAQLQERVA
jgi:hypothetical protein